MIWLKIVLVYAENYKVQLTLVALHSIKLTPQFAPAFHSGKIINETLLCHRGDTIRSGSYARGGPPLQHKSPGCRRIDRGT